MRKRQAKAEVKDWTKREKWQVETALLLYDDLNYDQLQRAVPGKAREQIVDYIA